MAAKHLVVFLLVSIFSGTGHGAENTKLVHESQAGVVIASGNSDTQTYNLKQTTSYEWDSSLLKFAGSYLLGRSSGTTSALRWDLGLRYDHVLSGDLAAIVGYQLDANPFAGVDLRHTFDLGGKYQFIKTDDRVLAGELGYRVTAERFTLDNGATSNGSLTSHLSRAYLEWNETWSPTISTKIWGEYLQSFTHTNDYRINFEPSVSIILSSVFSMKMAYLLTYRSVPAVAGKKTADAMYTTALVAKF